MSRKNSLKQRPSTRLNLKKILLYAIVASSSMVGGYFLLAALGVIGVNSNLTAQYTPGSGPVANGFTWSKVLTVDSSKVVGSSDLVDFPVIVHITDPDFIHVSNGGKVESINGYDIGFTGANSLLLDHQIESYNPVNGELIAWVRVPVLYASVNTEFDVVYGNPGITNDPSTDAVWNAGFISVWHMNNDPASSNLTDAAGINDGQPNGMSSNNIVAGVIGPAIEFDGSNDRFAIENINYSTSGCLPTLSVTAWVNTTHSSGGRPDNWSILDFDRSEYFNVYIHGNGKAAFSSRGSSNGINDFYAGNSGQVNDGNWHHVAMVYDGIDKYIYIDGVLEGMESNPHGGDPIGKGNVTRYAFIGDGSEASSFNGSRNNRHFDGKMDEIHFFEGGLTADWIATEYNNQISPETFISIEGASTPLPIELTSFDGWLTQGKVELEWVVASQINNDYFSIERSTDGVSFETIGTIKGAGTSSANTIYRFTDASPYEGISYYRLRQTDYNGKSELFDPIVLEYRKKVNQLTLNKAWPNPFSNQFTINYSVEDPTTVEISIVNLKGNTVFKNTVMPEKGENEYRYSEGSELPPGVYLVYLIKDGNSSNSLKLIKRENS